MAPAPSYAPPSPVRPSTPPTPSPSPTDAHHSSCASQHPSTDPYYSTHAARSLSASPLSTAYLSRFASKTKSKEMDWGCNGEVSDVWDGLGSCRSRWSLISRCPRGGYRPVAGDAAITKWEPQGGRCTRAWGANSRCLTCS